jgi:hypothetical protein
MASSLAARIRSSVVNFMLDVLGPTKDLPEALYLGHYQV